MREHLGVEKWSLFGQSFGGFCITAYLSQDPERVEYAFFTGGIPTLQGADDLYRATFSKLKSVSSVSTTSSHGPKTASKRSFPT